MSAKRLSSVEPPARSQIYGGFYFHTANRNSDYGWEACRETFRDWWRDSGRHSFFVSLSPPFLRSLVDYIETVLNIKQRHRTKIYPVKNNSGMSYVDLSQFWYSHHMRKEFLTALIKGCRNQSGKPSINWIIQNSYFCDTSRAAAMFVCGFNQPVLEQGFVGWVETFWAEENVSLSGRRKTLERRYAEWVCKRLRKPHTALQCRFFLRSNPKSRLTSDEIYRLLGWVLECESCYSNSTPSRKRLTWDNPFAPPPNIKSKAPSSPVEGM